MVAAEKSLAREFQYEADNQEEILNCSEFGRYSSIAMGDIYSLEEYIPEEPSADPVTDDNIDTEIERLDSAFQALLEDNQRHQSRIDTLIEKSYTDNTEAELEMKAMLEFESLMLQDSSMIGKIKKSMRNNNKSAARAAHEFFMEKKKYFEAEDNEKIREFAGICEDIRHNLLTVMSGHLLTSLVDTPADSILVASRIQPKDMTNLIIDGRPHVAAMINETGTNLDHTNVVAGSIGIMVSRIRDKKLWQRIAEAKYAIIDGYKGKIILNPNEQTKQDYQARKAELERTHKILGRRSREQEIPVTRDDREIKVYINAEFTTEIARVHNNYESDLNTSGVGLYRTEFALIDHYTPRPEEADKRIDWERNLDEKWSALFEDLATKTGKKTLTIRTVDFEGDKGIAEKADMDENEKDAIIRTQMRAAIKTKQQHPETNLQLMIPTVRGAAHFKKYQNMMREESGKLGIPPVSLGAMAEIFSFIDTGIEHVKPDFVSIGTNDLIAHIIGYDRYKPSEQHFYDPTNRSVLKTLRRTFNKCSGLKTSLNPGMTFANTMRKIFGRYTENKHIPLSVCGDMASDPRYLAILIGCGITRVSCGVAHVPTIKEMISRIDTKKAKRMVTELIKTEDIGKRIAILDAFNSEYLGYIPNKNLVLFPKSEEERVLLEEPTAA